MGMTKIKGPTLRQFQDRFPTEESCLDHLMRVRYGERHTCQGCGKEARYYRVNNRRSYACEWCGYQVYPTAGTPFDRTRTPLRDWFFVMFQFVTSRNGVAAKEVERQLGVTYKTAWRMCHEIRKYMGAVDGCDPIGGLGKTVQIDETFIGGRLAMRKVKGRQPMANKTTVFGMMEVGGEVVMHVVPDRRSGTLLPIIRNTVKRASTIHTDEWLAYGGLGTMGYQHHAVNHSAEEYVCRKTGATVNGLEGFWAQLKRGINGTHIHVSAKHLPKYLGEFEFRHNRRNRPETMLTELLLSFPR
jgi:transposase-like protein